MSLNKLLIGLVLLLVFFRWLLPGSRVATDFPATSQSALKLGFQLPQTWTTRFGNGLGEYHVGTLWAWPMDVLYGLGGVVGLDFSLLERIIGLGLALVLGWWGMSKLAGHLSAFIYITGTYFLLLIDGGQLSLAAAYGLFPLCLYLYFRALDLRRLANNLQFTLSVLLLSVLDLRIVYLLGLAIGLHLLFLLITVRRLPLRRLLLLALITGLSLLGLHAFWLLPAVMTRIPQLPAGYTQSDQVSFLSFADLTHAFLWLQPHWPRNLFSAASSPRAEFIIFPVLAFLPLIVKFKSPLTRYWLWLALFSVFLIKGSTPPVSGLYPWLFSHIPGFTLFRDPTKFFFLSSLAYSVLIGSSISFLSQKIKLITPLFIILVLIICLPVVTGQMTGTFSFPRFASDYSAAADYLNQDSGYGRILWLPSRPPLGYISPSHPTLEGLNLAGLRPFSVGIVGSYETLNYLRDASYSAQLLDIVGVKYVAFPPPDPLRDSTKAQDRLYHDHFFHQLQQAPWSGSTLLFGQLPLIATRSHSDQFFSPQTTAFVIGSDDVYKSVPDLRRSAFVFAEDQPGLLAQINRLPRAAVLVNHKTRLDVAAALVPSSGFTFPAAVLADSPDSSGWWRRETGSFVWLRNFLQQKYALDNQDFDYQGGWAVAEGRVRHQFSLPGSSARRILLARVLTSPRGGRLVFSQSGRSLGTLNTVSASVSASLVQKGLSPVPDKIFTYFRSDFVWQAVGELADSSPVTVSTTGDINIINALMTVSPTDWSAYLAQADRLLDRPVSSSGNPEVVYHQLSPTHISVHISGLASPGLLVFSQSYDPLWHLSGQPSLPVYSILNGFPVAENGNYDLVFTPQAYVLPGLAVSVISLAVFISFLLLSLRLKK